MTFNILWSPTAAKHLKYWQKHSSQKVVKIRELCKSIEMTPNEGLGKPEKLKFFDCRHNIWSRRIDREHRLVYQVKNNKEIIILQARYHY